MLVWLAELLTPYFSFLNVFSYLTFRAIVSILTGLGLSLWLGPRLIKRLQKMQVGQVVREEGPESHLSKSGTPTMGGILILLALITSVLLWCQLSNPMSSCLTSLCLSVLLVLLTITVKRKNTEGLSAR